MHSLGVNAPRVWDTVHRAAWASLADKRVPRPLDTSPCSPCSTRAGPATMQSKEKIQKNSSPRANLLLRPPAGRLLADIMVSTDWVQPPKWSCGSTGENSHLASFKRKVQSQLLYSQSGNGHNLKLLSFKKRKKHIHPLFPSTLSSGGKSDSKGSCLLRKIWLVCQFTLEKSAEQKSQATMLMMTLKGT